MITSNDLLKEALYFIYEESPVSYIVFGLNDSLHVYREKRPVETVIMTTSGEIESSLWNAMVGNGSDPALAISLSEVFAWSIDFFGIQKGDSYKVIYEELNVDGTTIGTGRILGAFMHHNGTEYYAIYFNQGDKGGDYFDYNGGSVRREFLKAPLNFKRISSHFSNSRLHPVLKIRRPHHGVDYAAEYGTPVVTIGDGLVIDKGWDKGGGNYLKVKHNSVYTTVYMHLSKFAKGLNKGDRVSQGEVIGYVGSTGLSTGPHLDFRIFRNGSAVDPLKVESPPSEPVSAEYMSEFITYRDSLVRVINGIGEGHPGLVAR
jgi:murein DD-endopeptidase MepM/ murein hydrolase activator NlpD